MKQDLETKIACYCSDDEASSEQGVVPGLSSFMAKALKVVSAPDAFLQKEQASRNIALPCFSFNKRGALVKTMSRKHSTGSQQVTTGSTQKGVLVLQDCSCTGTLRMSAIRLFMDLDTAHISYKTVHGLGHCTCQLHIFKQPCPVST